MTTLTDPVAPLSTSAQSAGPRIVGIGASAGGFAAIEKFISQIVPECGLAYIIVQHLDPTQRALLAELLQRTTELPVNEAENGVLVEANHIYVIAPNTELSVVNSRLKTAKPTEPRGLRLPVNVLFSSLASSQGERAIGVILSGMGNDGTLGAQSIKATGGLTLAQEPSTAQFDSMPKSVIAAGFADIVVAPEEMPACIQSFIGQARETDAAEQYDTTVVTPAPLKRIVQLLHSKTRHDFSLYKPSTLQRRIERRKAIHNIESEAEYAEFLQHNPQEADLLFKEMLIGVTSFFRYTTVWETLASSILPELLDRCAGNPAMRAWCVGCSTGEEAYSLAMIFTEILESMPVPQKFTLQIFASDLSPDAISMARRGHYPRSISTSVSPARLSRFFSEHDTYFQINKKIRDMVLFARHDVVMDPPFTKLDLLICRNLLI